MKLFWQNIKIKFIVEKNKKTREKEIEKRKNITGSRANLPFHL